MGQYESKQRFHQIQESIKRIRKDVRNGKITGNDVERIQGILQKYSTEIQSNSGAKVGRNDVYTLEQLIEITSKELDGLKEEVQLDGAAVQTNSFKRGSKNFSKEKRKSIKSIADAVETIRTQIRNGEVQNSEQVQADLVNYSQQLSALKGKKQEIDKTQKLISSVTQELFSKQQPENQPDNISIRSSTNSLTRQNNRRRSSLKEQEIRKETPNIASKNTTGTLDDIENKLETLKNDIKVAENNKDKSRLRFLAKSIQTLMTDLQMVDVKNQIINEEKKELLEKNLQRYYHQIEKIKRQISTESNLNYLVELEKKQKKEKYIEQLEGLQQTLIDATANLNSGNYQSEKENFPMYKNKLDSIEELDQDVTHKKAEISDNIMNLENAIARLEMEDRLNQAEWRHCQYKLDLSKFQDTPDDESYKKHRQYLSQLHDYVGKILEVSQKIDEKKKYVLFNINNNIIALDKKAKENEERVKEEVTLRNMTSPNSTNRSVADNLLKACEEVPNSSSSEAEMRSLLSTLNQARTIIEQKMTMMQNQWQQEPAAILVTIKETETEPSMKNVMAVVDSIHKEVASLPDETPAQIIIVKEDDLKSSSNEGLQIEEIVTEEIQEIDAQNQPLYNPKLQIRDIQKEVQSLQIRIENSRYTKETQLYKDTKYKLENYKSQATELSRQNDEGKSLLKFVDNVLQLLENNAIGRKSTTEDLLVDIMSVSTRVNDLGSKIHSYGCTPQDKESIKTSLLEHQEYLKNMKISPNRTNLFKSRQEILNQTASYLLILQDFSNGENLTSEEEKLFNQELRKLKEKVSRYTGTYKNVLYKTIENDLDKHLARVDEIFKDPNFAAKLKQEIDNCKMILEQKSTKVQNHNEPKNIIRYAGSEELNEIRKNIESVKNELNQVRRLTKEELNQLDARLNLSIVGLDNIKNERFVREKERLYQDINTYVNQIRELKLISKGNTKPHSVLLENLPMKQMKEEQQAVKIMSSIGTDLEEIKDDILTFVGTETSPKFAQLDEVLVRGTLKLDELNVTTSSSIYPIKAKLIKELQKYSDILEERIHQTEEIEKLENDVKVMLMKIDSFNGYFGDPEYTFLDEQIIKLKVSLGKLHVNQELIARREACIREVDSCMKKLNEAAKPRTDVITGTLV